MIMTDRSCKDVDAITGLPELNTESEPERSGVQISEPFVPADDGKKALVSAECLEKARQIIVAGTMAGRIEKKDLGIMKRLMLFCASEASGHSR